jgi:hypothetical protein
VSKTIDSVMLSFLIGDTDGVFPDEVMDAVRGLLAEFVEDELSRVRGVINVELL